MRETGCISFSTAVIQHLDQKQLKGEGFISAHRLQSTTERSQGRNSRPWRQELRQTLEYCSLAGGLLA